jgi:hypothetical protein
MTTNMETCDMERNVEGGVPFCLQCLDSMKCVKTGALIACSGGPVRRAFGADLFECQHCGARVALPAREGFDVQEENLAMYDEATGGQGLIQIPADNLEEPT